MLIFVDTETTGVSVYEDRIVELAATQAPTNPRYLGASFSMIVRVDPEVLAERGDAAEAVHGITKEEISKGTAFPDAWQQFVQWTDDLLNMAVVEQGESDSEVDLETRLMPETPTLLMAAHNGQNTLCFRHEL